jgi:hypothetical protein
MGDDNLGFSHVDLALGEAEPTQVEVLALVFARISVAAGLGSVVTPGLRL